MKKSRSSATNYFNGTVTDGKTNIRFDAKLQHQFADFQKNKDTAAISNCEIKPSKQNDQLEVKSFSALKRSPSNFHVPDDVITTLGQLDDMSLCQQVKVASKTVHVHNPGLVPNKQDVYLADIQHRYCQAGSLGGGYWKNTSYTLTGLVHIYNSNKYIYTCIHIAHFLYGILHMCTSMCVISIRQEGK